MRRAIVYYHSVGGPPPQTLDRERFVAHLDALVRLGVRVRTVSELVEGDEPGVALSFDDGLLDNVEIALPLLRERGLRATFYVVPGHADRTRWVDARTGRWSDEPRPGYDVPHPVSGPRHWERLAEAGMEVGCHGASHRPLTRVPADELEAETAGAREALQTVVGPVRSFSYPFGRVGPRSLLAVRRAGFGTAVTTVPGPVERAPSRFLLPRFLVEDPRYFEAVVTGRALRPGPLARLAKRAIYPRSR